LFVHDMYRQDFRAPRHPKGMVLVRQTGKESRGVDTALRSEADKTARPLALHRRGHHVHRVVERAGEMLEDRCLAVRRRVAVRALQLYSV
jgi:hypothetical protein